MSILEIILMVLIGVGTITWCVIMVVKCVNRKRNVKIAKKEIQEDDEEREEE